VDDDRESYTDLAPGLYRVVLDGDHDRYVGGDVDILQGRLTVLRVERDYLEDEYRVHMELE